MKRIWWLFAAAMISQKWWKYWLVRRFFGRPVPVMQREPRLVSIMQPILSGDPTLRECLQANLTFASRYQREYIWLVDDNDAEAQHICAALVAEHPDVTVQMMSLPPPAARTNPKTVKLVAGLAQAQGEIICVLDDDTRLPDGGLEQCLPWLDTPQAGLVFGLPYYRSFDTVWSSLVALFVNDHSLLTYVPYTALTEPFTINGMFYAMGRDVLNAVGGFSGLEHVLADDFAVASRLRDADYRLVQTPLRHAISTHVADPRQYLSLIQRWFIFPRESLMRHLAWTDRAILYGLGALPALFPLALVIGLLLKPSRAMSSYVALYFGSSLWMFQHLNVRYLSRATPLRWLWAVPLVEVVFPLQLLAALLAPQRIVWRGHVMQVERGGGFRFVRRRPDAA